MLSRLKTLDICTWNDQGYNRGLFSLAHHGSGVVDVLGFATKGPLPTLNLHGCGKMGSLNLQGLQSLRLSCSKLHDDDLAAALRSCNGPGLKEFFYEARLSWLDCEEGSKTGMKLPSHRVCPKGSLPACSSLLAARRLIVEHSTNIQKQTGAQTASSDPPRSSGTSSRTRGPSPRYISISASAARSYSTSTPRAVSRTAGSTSNASRRRGPPSPPSPPPRTFSLTLPPSTSTMPRPAKTASPTC